MTCTDSPSVTAFDNLVQLAISLRPTWQAPGVKAAIRKALEREQTFTFADLAFAVASVASDKASKTPAPIAMDGLHWKRATAVPNRSRYQWHELCEVCSYPPAGHVRHGDHEFVANGSERPGIPSPAEVSQAARADMAATHDRAKQAAETNEEAT